MKNQSATPEPMKDVWWKSAYAWMVISGPLIVVVASVITFYVIARAPNPVVENYYVKGLEINKTLEAEALAPAMKARNHAATGIELPSKDLPQTQAE